MKKCLPLSMLILTVGAFSSGCANRAACNSPEGNPGFYYLAGMEALDSGKVPAAQDKFERALKCNGKFTGALDGLALIGAEKVRDRAETKAGSAELEKSRKTLEKSRKLGKTPNEEFEYHATVIRMETAAKGKGWIETIENAYKEASVLKVDDKLAYYQGQAALDYFMGVAYWEALEFATARDYFAKAASARPAGKWNDKAERSLSKADRIVRAVGRMNLGEVAKKIALKGVVTRADIAALLVDEVKIDKLIAGRIPGETPVVPVPVESVPPDVVNDPLNRQILSLMKWQLRGMELKYDEGVKGYLYRPAASMTRGELALLLEDLLIKLTGNEKLAKAHHALPKSPFPDLRTNSPYFNAAVNMTTRGIMAEEVSGAFRANDPVDGAEALLAVRVFKERVNIY